MGKNSNMTEKINSVIKYRESYRPFAPSVKFEDADKYFEVPNGYECFFMEKVIPVKVEYRKKLPAITHVDGSARLHTVKKGHNALFYDLLDKFEEISEYPILLITFLSTKKFCPNDFLSLNISVIKKFYAFH